MTVALYVASGFLAVCCFGLLGYWIYLSWKAFKTFRLIMSVERKLATLVLDGKKRLRANDSVRTERGSSVAKIPSALKKNSKKSLKSSRKSHSSPKSKPSTKSTGSSKSPKASKSSKSTKSRSGKDGGAAGKDRRQSKPLVRLEIHGPHPKVERPPDRENFVEMVEKLSVFVKNYMKCPEQYPVSNDALPGFLYQRLDTHPPTKPTSFDTVLLDFEKLIIPGMTHFKHPRYLASNVLSRSVPDIVGEVLAVHIGSPGFVYDASPAVAEMQVAMLNWAGRALGIPERFLFYANSETCQGGASFQESIGDSTLCALMVARTAATQRQYVLSEQITKEESYLFADGTRHNLAEHHSVYGKLCVYASSEAHPTLDKQCRLAMLRLRRIPALPENGYGITARQVDKKIKKDLALGRIPCCIVVTLGTDAILANDELGRIGRLGQKYNCWVHVMAHNVSSFWLEPKFRPPVEELQYAHSIMGQLPYHSANMVVVWTKNQSAWKDGFKIFAQYLKPSKNFAIDERDWTIHLNRRFRGIKVWLNYRLIGLKRMREHVNQICRLTAYLEAKLSSNENIRVFGGRVLNCFCFTYFEKGLSPTELARYTRLLGVYINESHRLFLKITNVAGTVVLSVSISYEDTTIQLIDEMYSDLQELIAVFRGKKSDPTLLKFPPQLEMDSSDTIMTLVRTALSNSGTSLQIKEIGLPSPQKTQ